MTRIGTLILYLSATLGAVTASSVIDLTPDNFDKVVNAGKPSLVEFFAPWCGHCKTLAPIYEELAQSFQHAGDKVVIAKVDADEHKSLGSKFGVQGFPTLKWFDGKTDKPEDYSGGRDLESLTAFIQGKTGLKTKSSKPPSQVAMLNDRKFNQTIGGDKNVLVAFTAVWCGHCKSLAPIWEQLALDFVNEPSVVIAKIDAESPDSKKTAKDEGVTGFPTIKFFAAGTDKSTLYEGARTEQSLIDFVNKQTGTFRSVGGRLSDAAGTIPSIDDVLQKIVDAGSDFAGKAEDVLSAIKGEKGQYAEYYGKVVEKIKKNAGYVNKELTRLEGILKKGTLAPQKLDDLTTRRNILRKFKATDEKSEL